MEQGKVHIDELFRLKAQQQPLPLPPGAWNELKPRLDEGKPRLPLRWWYVLPLVLLVSVGFFMLKSSPALQTAPAPSATTVAQMTDPSVHKDAATATPADTVRKIDNTNPTRKAQPILTPKYTDKMHERTQPAQAIPSIQTVSPAAKTISTKQPTESPQTTPAAQVSTVSSSDPAPAAEVQKRPDRKAASAAAITASPSSHANTITAMPSLAASQIQSQKPIDWQRNTKPKQADVVPIPPSVAPVEAEISTKAAENNMAPKKFSSPSGQSAQVISSSKSPSIEPSSSPAVSATAEPTTKSAAITHTVARITMATTKTDTLAKERPRRKQLPLSFGFKAGYEAGAGTPSVNKFVAAPFLQYSLGSGFSLSLQPAIKAGTTRGFSGPVPKSYYSLTGTTVDSQTISKNGRPFWQITYIHGYDSITVAYTAGTSALEFELLLLLRYSLKNGFFFGGGPQLTFGSLIAITEQRQTAHLTQTAVFQIEKAGTHPPPDTSKSFNHTAAPYAGYVSQEHSAQAPLRIGYQLNAGYEYKRWLVEIGLQQTLSGLSSVSSPQLKDAYSMPYFRLLAGYRFGRK